MMSVFRKPLRQQKVKLKLAGLQGAVCFIPWLSTKPSVVFCWCWYCHWWYPLRRLTIEHLVNRRDGGTDREDNLVLACTGCNKRRNKREQHQLKRVNHEARST